MCEIHTLRCGNPGCGRLWREYVQLPSCEDKKGVCGEYYCMFAGRPDEPKRSECDDCHCRRQTLPNRAFAASLEVSPSNRTPAAVPEAASSLGHTRSKTASAGGSGKNEAPGQRAGGGDRVMGIVINKAPNTGKPQPKTRFTENVRVVHMGTTSVARVLPPGRQVVQIPNASEAVSQAASREEPSTRRSKRKNGGGASEAENETDNDGGKKKKARGGSGKKGKQVAQDEAAARDGEGNVAGGAGNVPGGGLRNSIQESPVNRAQKNSTTSAAPKKGRDPGGKSKSQDGVEVPAVVPAGSRFGRFEVGEAGEAEGQAWGRRPREDIAVTDGPAATGSHTVTGEPAATGSPAATGAATTTNTNPGAPAGECHLFNSEYYFGGPHDCFGLPTTDPGVIWENGYQGDGQAAGWGPPNPIILNTQEAMGNWTGTGPHQISAGAAGGDHNMPAGYQEASPFFLEDPFLPHSSSMVYPPPPPVHNTAFMDLAPVHNVGAGGGFPVPSTNAIQGTDSTILSVDEMFDMFLSWDENPAN